MSVTVTVTPANQRRRIATLRIAMLICLPAIFFTRPGAPVTGLPLDIVESVGILLIISGVLGRFWSILYIGGHKNAQVMQDGPYSICRHPLYLFSTTAVLGFGMMLGSVIVTIALTGAVFAILSNIAAKEERFLRGTFGRDYETYAARVPRILPAPRQFRTAPTVTFDVTTLKRNLRDALVFLSLIPLGELMEHFKELNAWPTFPVW